MNPIDQFLKNKEPRTQKNYKWILNEYFREIKQDPDTYIKKDKDYREQIKTWWEQHLDEVPKTRHTKLAVVKSFLESYEIVYPKSFWIERRRERKGRRAATLDRVPTAAEFKAMLLHGDIKDKALFLFLSSSGMRIDEVLQLKLSDKLKKNLEHDPPLIEISASIAKTGDPRITFITPEAKDNLLEWLNIRKAYIDRAIKRTQHLCNKNPNDDTVFPFSYDVAWTRWINLLKKTGLNQRDEKTNRYVLHIHCLRKYFLSQLKLEIPEVVAEAFAGHEKYLDESYRRFTREQLGDYYKKGMHRLNVFETQPDTTHIQKRMDQKDKTIEDMQKRIDTLENKYGDLLHELVVKKKK